MKNVGIIDIGFSGERADSNSPGINRYLTPISDGGDEDEDDIVIKLVAGRWYDAGLTFQCDTMTTFQVYLKSGLDEIGATPIYIGETTQIDRLSLEVTTAKAGGSGYLGLYEMKNNGLPGNLLHQAPDSFTTDTTGAKELDVDITLQKGWYWLAAAYTKETDGAYYRAIANNEALSIMGFTNSTQTNKDLLVYANITLGGGMPAVFPSPNYFPVQCARVMFRVKP
jgi:hypothetical protein